MDRTDGPNMALTWRTGSDSCDAMSAELAADGRRAGHIGRKLKRKRIAQIRLSAAP